MGHWLGIPHTRWYSMAILLLRAPPLGSLLQHSQTGQLQHQVVSPKRKAKKQLGKVYIVEGWRPFDGTEKELFEAGTLTLNGNSFPCPFIFEQSHTCNFFLLLESSIICKSIPFFIFHNLLQCLFTSTNSLTECRRNKALQARQF